MELNSCCNVLILISAHFLASNTIASMVAEFSEMVALLVLETMTIYLPGHSETRNWADYNWRGH